MSGRFIEVDCFDYDICMVTQLGSSALKWCKVWVVRVLYRIQLLRWSRLDCSLWGVFVGRWGSTPALEYFLVTRFQDGC